MAIPSIEKNEDNELPEVFVLVPKKSENRGKYLQRCASHPKMKEQFSDRKERAVFCLTSFNEYYKWWVKIDKFGEEDTKGTALGDCIANKKSQGLDYKSAYARCASKVVAPSGPIVLSEDDDNLIIEPVAMEGLEDACWEGYEAIGLKDDGTPNCVPIKMTDDDFAESITDYPEGVKTLAKAAVDYAEKNGWGSCGTAIGKTRASQLSKGDPISVDTLKRMYSYLSRHKTDLTSSKGYDDGCGKLMYDAWGGAAGLTYSERKLKQLEK